MSQLSRITMANKEEMVVDKKISSLFEVAFRMHQTGDFDGADSIYREILRLNPAHFDALHLSGLIAAQSGLPELAIELMSKSLRVRDDPVANNNLGIVYHEVQLYGKALECYRNALSSNPVYSEAFYNLGNTLFAMQNFDKAIASYEDAINLDPNYVNAHLNLGISLHELGMYELAIASYDLALEIKPDYAHVFYNRALANHALQRLDLALLDIERAVIFNPTHAEALAFQLKFAAT